MLTVALAVWSRLRLYQLNIIIVTYHSETLVDYISDISKEKDFPKHFASNNLVSYSSF